jgi:2-hydroxy-3-oxopropionate reductase
MSDAGLTVGVIGLGAMGGAIAARLLGRGVDVAAFDPRAPARAAVAGRGGRDCGSPAEAAAGADIVLTSLPGAVELREVLFGDAGVLGAAAGSLRIVDMSTLTPRVARELHDEVAAGGAVLLDAPVSGGPDAARGGTLTIMIGGGAQDVDAAQPVLEQLGTVYRCGPAGAGQVCKACNQLIVVGTIELVAEALVVAGAAGLDPELVRSALLGGYAASRVLELHGARMLERDFTPGGRAKFNLKDIDALASLADEHGLRLPAFQAAAGQLARLIDCGGGELDNSALITMLEPATPVAS